ncbi:MAG: hypothetical protein PHE15_02505 [Dehalococcoidales bacterium]|nr:hypothetical protein [Dehalococcoidales bacterium]
MSDIKSAHEIAMEKIARLGDATEEEQLKWKYIPEGEKLATSCLNDNSDIKSKINNYDKKIRSYILKGAETVFLANIGIPKNENIKNNNKKAMDNLLFIKNDKSAVKEIYEKIDFLFKHYDEQGKQQREQSYELLKSDYQNKLEKAIDQKLGSSSNININVESLPQFQEEWRKVISKLDAQYSNYLDEYKQELKNID